MIIGNSFLKSSKSSKITKQNKFGRIEEEKDRNSALKIDTRIKLVGLSHTSLVADKNTWLQLILDSILFYKQLLIHNRREIIT